MSISLNYLVALFYLTIYESLKPFLCGDRKGLYETCGKKIKASLNITWATTKKTPPKHQQKTQNKTKKDGGQGYLKPEICSIVHKHHQCSKTHIIATPRATHQPNGCQVMNDMSQKIL